jgi:hypothetical protein
MNCFSAEEVPVYVYGTLSCEYQQVDSKDMVDPQLVSPDFSPELSWGSLPMTRFILGSSKAHPETSQEQQQQPLYSLPLAASHVDHLFDVNSMSNRRGGSPFSQHHRSSTCSSGQSPAGDADFYGEGLQGPSTPQDMAVASPYVTQPQYEHWNGLYAPTSLGEPHHYGPAGPCVNPSALAPDYPAVHYQGPAETNAGPSFDSGREQRFDSPNSSSHYDAGSSDFASSPHPTSASMRLGAHDEIHVKSYLPLPSQYNMLVEPSDEAQRSTMDSSNRSSPYDTLTGPTTAATKQPQRRKKNARPAGRRDLLKRRHTDSHSEQGRNTFTSHAVPAQRLLTSLPSGPVQCDQCSSSFKDESTLKKHKRTDHTRPFVCVFHYAGCSSSFAAKNEWKRHVTSQHLSLTYWLCTHGACARSRGPPNQQRSLLLPPTGVIFNRKDLFTQHIRRMHSPDDRDPKTKGGSPQLEERLKAMQDAAYRKRCDLPVYMKCPAQNCAAEFRGSNAWDERMEHVARHLEAAAVNEEPPIFFGGEHDYTLTHWAEADGIEVVKRTATGWEICNPLKGEGATRKSNLEMYEEDQDAEGDIF